MIGSRRPVGDLIVVGAGIAGLSAAWAATRLGFSVTCVEARRVGHTHASSAGWAKIFRYAYQQRRFAELLLDTEERWRDLEARTGRKLLTQCTGVNIGKVGSPYMAAIVDSLDTVGRRYDVLAAESAPLGELGIRLPEGEEAILEHDAGALVPDIALETLSQEFRKCGGKLLEEVTVRNVAPGPGGRLRVDTDAGTLDADRVILAMGPWIRDLVPTPPVPLTITAQQQVMVVSDRPIGDGRQYSWAEVVDDDGYGFVNLAGQRHVIGSHRLGPLMSHPAAAEPEPVPALRDQIAKFRSRLAGDIELKELRLRTCLYTNAGGDDFLVRPSDDLSGVVLLSACSGHGFKFALTNGHRAAEIAAA